MADYSCFLHPEQSGDSLEETCGVCGKRFDFPLEHPPDRINEKRVLEGESRGFYGAVFVTEHARTRRRYAAKLVPCAAYAPTEEGGYSKDFQEEVRLHLELSDINLVAALQDYGEHDFRFGDQLVRCYWTEMEYVEGPTLAQKVEQSPDDPREVAQIAWDLLDFIDALQQRGRFHNDLHGGNIKVVNLRESEARRQAIHSHVAVRVFDLGSAASKSKSRPGRLGDVHRVAQHILDLLNAYERTHQVIEPANERLCAQLRRVAEFYCAGDRYRLPSPEDVKSRILSAYRFGIRPWAEPVHLESIADHYNAQTLPPWFAPHLLVDPEGQWIPRLTAPGPQLLTGMRGCGKTILLRSLEWPARAHKVDDEALEDVVRRLEKETFLGLFVSCASLLQGPRPGTVQLIFHRLFLAFAREVVRDVHMCELEKIGEIDYNALKPFVELLKRVIPWYESPNDPLDFVEIERSLSKAIRALPSDGGGIAELSPRDVFDDLARASRRLMNLWAHKKLLFLLDDVSTRYLPVDDIAKLLSQFCLQSPEFGFKISTETQTLELTTPSGEPARSGRDYEYFDLGAEVHARLKGPNGADFIETVLYRRSQITTGAPTQPPSKVLGKQRLADIAKAIREQPSKSSVYWGLQGLAGVCVGDIGDVLQLYALMLERAAGKYAKIPAKIQHQAITDFAERKLFSLAGRDPWLLSHAVAFARASHRELRRSAPERLRQYNEIFVRIDPTDGTDVFEKLIRLIDNGVFVFTGGTPRTKTPEGAPSLMFKLAYRKLLGVTNRIPLSLRDRFEVSGGRLADWLDQPSAAKLEPGVSTEAEDHEAIAELPADADVSSLDSGKSTEPMPIQSTLWSERSAPAGTLEPGLPPARVLHDVQTLAAGDISDIATDWPSKHVIAAFGFEERSEGAWRNLLAVGRPGGITMLRYPDPGLTEAIVKLFGSLPISFDARSVESLADSDHARMILESCGDKGVVIDTTSLTKALIYILVSTALVHRGEVWVLHTCASEYYPPESELSEVVDLFKSRKWPEAFGKVDTIVAGEVPPFSCESVGAQYVDPSEPTLMAAFVSLKHKRVAQLLEEQAPIESVAAIAPVHSAGPNSPRSIAARYVAEYLVQLYGGEVHEVDSLDHEGAYRVLRDLHRRYSLQGGYNFGIGLTGTKMHAVGAAMLASTVTPAGAYYSAPARFDPARFTKGTAETLVVHLQRVAMESA